MILNMSGGGGGSSMELTVVGGLTRPAKPTQNMIWVPTDVEITGYALSATEPENLIEGMVVITIGDSGSTKIPAPVGDNWVTVYPISAKQYVSGAWVNKTAKSYQNGEWVEWWDGYLYKAGDEYTAITGGWDFYKENTAATGTKSAESITITSAGDYKAINCHTKNPIDFSGVDTLKINVLSTTDTAGTSAYFGLTTTPDNIGTENFAAYSFAKKGVTTLDVSALNGVFYVVVAVISSRSVTFDEIKLEWGS